MSIKTILGIRISALNKKQALAWIEKRIERNEKIMVVTPNPEQIVLAQKDPSFRKILNSAQLALADGVGLVWASRILRTRGKLKKRVTGEEVMNELIKKAAEKGRSVFLLGAKPGIAKEAADILKTKYQKLKIEVSSGAKEISRESGEERKKTIDDINSFAPDLLFVAYGAPWQEKWLADNFKQLNIKVGMVVGGALDMIVDPSLKPLSFMTSRGLDWLYRLFRQPWRIKRQLALLKFVVLVLEERIGM